MHIGAQAHTTSRSFVASLVVLYSLAVKPVTALSGRNRQGRRSLAISKRGISARGAVRRTRVSPSIGEQVARAHAQSRSTRG